MYSFKYIILWGSLFGSVNGFQVSLCWVFLGLVAVPPPPGRRTTSQTRHGAGKVKSQGTLWSRVQDKERNQKERKKSTYSFTPVPVRRVQYTISTEEARAISKDVFWLWSLNPPPLIVECDWVSRTTARWFAKAEVKLTPTPAWDWLLSTLYILTIWVFPTTVKHYNI